MSIRLGEIAEKIDYGVTASASPKPVGPRFLRITDIQNNQVCWADVPWCECEPRARAASTLSSGDIVFARTGATTGKSFLIRECPEETVFASYLIRVRLNREQADPQYVSHFFASDAYWRQISKSAQGAAQPGVNASKLKQLEIPLPPLAEQKRISGILDAADALRAKRRESIAELHSLIRATFLDMFGDPILNPMGWPLMDFGDCIEDHTRRANKVPKSGYGDRGRWPIIDQSQNEVAGFSDVEGAFTSPLPVVVFGDHTRCVKLVSEPFLLGADGAKVLVTKTALDPVFLRYMLPKLGLPDLGYSRHMKELKRLKFLVPPLQLQERFSAFVAEARKQAELMTAHESQLDLLFASLQSRAFSGEL